MNPRFYIRFLLLIFLGCDLSSAYAQSAVDTSNVYVLRKTQEPVSIGRHAVFFEDPSDTVSFSGAQKKLFAHKDADIPNFNITPNAIWGKIRFTSRENEDWYLSFDPATYNEIQFWTSVNSGPWKHTRFGTAFPNEERPLAINHYAIKIGTKPGDTATVYFRVNDYYPIQLEMRAGTIESFTVWTHNADVYNGICYGIMIMMLLYNLYLYISQRNVIYIYYVLYVLCSLIFSAYLSGYSLHFPDFLLAILHFAPIIPPAGFGIFGLLFTLKLFGEALGKRLRRTIWIFMSVAFADVILSAVPATVYISENIIQPLGLCLGVLCINAAIVAVRKKQKSGIYYLLGFGIYMASLFYLILTAQGAFRANGFTWHALVTGSAVEAIMLSFALGDKVKTILREKEKAQADALEQSKENERLVKEQNILLEQKVKERTLELEEKNTEILDSIHYAKRIQQTLLAQDAFLQQHLPDHFVFFKPKDIVSGDFYWATTLQHNNENDIYLAVCDSTGHGVPGAFMSLLNITFLNEAISEKNILRPNEVFGHVRQRLINTISRDGGQDGMDGILVHYDQDHQKLWYAAANNPPVLIRNKEIILLNADKMPVGKGEKTDPFALYEIDIQKDDVLYLYTDGYADQFGGPKGKKFKYKQLDNLFITHHQKSTAEQKEILETTFKDWKGNLEQVDDVLIIGIRF